MARPAVQITADGTDVTGNIMPGLVSLSITDGVGIDSDSVRFEIDDKDGVIEPPEKGAELQVQAGYEDDLYDFGTFIVDQVSLSGWPQVISVTARSMDGLSEAKQERDESYLKEDYPTYGDIFEELAGRMELGSSISEDIASKAIEYESQFGESDIAFASRLGDKVDAAVSIKEKTLVVVPRGSGQAAGGSSLPTIEITRPGNLISYNVTTVNVPKHSTVRAVWFDRQENVDKEIVVSSGEEGPEFLLRRNFQSEDDAREEAQAVAESLKRGEGNAMFEIDGTPSARAESYVNVSGVRDLVDGEWRATTVTHSFSGGGSYTTQILCESTGESGE